VILRIIIDHTESKRLCLRQGHCGGKHWESLVSLIVATVSKFLKYSVSFLNNQAKNQQYVDMLAQAAERQVRRGNVIKIKITRFFTFF
jgi:hypothetical protein